MKNPLLFLPLFFLCSANAQTFLPLDFPAFENGTEFSDPWVGGLNAPQWAGADLNDDGLPDLFAFDRNGDKPLAFLNQDGTPGSIDYQFDHAATANFPFVRHFVLLRDFNGDGVVDLFSSSFDEFQKGIKVYRGAWEDGLLQFNRVTFPSLDQDVLYHEMNGEIIGLVNVFLAFDYPAIDDLDGDGDLDILSMNQPGDKLIFYKNISLESGFTTDTLMFELADDCWGNIWLPPFSQSFLLSSDPEQCAFFTGPTPIEDRSPPHGGSTLCTFDTDADGDKELLYGDLIYETITLGVNGGTPETAWMTGQDTTFPSGNVPVGIPNLPATYYLDVNNDGARDLIASPNLIDGSPDRETVHFYRNEGSDEQPDFQFQTSELLADGILDFGTGAAPAIADVNADGLLDIVVANRFEFAGGMEIPTLALLLNTGTPTAPAFDLKNRNWLDFSELDGFLARPTPTFGDLDNDGDDDLLIGGEEGFLHLFENIAGAGMPMEFADPVFLWQNIDVGKSAAPCIADVDEDGLPDLLIGEQKGTVNYFPNLGTPTEPSFHPIPEEFPNNPFFGEINTQPLGSAVGYSQPVVLDFGAEKQIVVGTFRGWMPRLLIDSDNLSVGAFEVLDEHWGDLREGRNTRLAFADLDSDGELDVVVGNDRGGISLFRSPITVDGTVDVSEPTENELPTVRVFPNPTSGKVNLVGATEAEVAFFDMFGQLVFLEKISPGEASLDLGDLPTGIYFLKVKKGGLLVTKRLVVSKK